MKSQISRIKFYMSFIILSFVLNTLIEAVVIWLGIVNYTVEPQFLGIAWFTYLIYPFWTLTSYSVGNFLSKKTKLHRYIFYFLIGALFAFCFDLYFTSVNFYFYRFNSILRIGLVPIEDFFAVGLMMTVSVAVSDFFVKKYFKSILYNFPS